MKANNDTFDQLVSIPDEIRIIPYNLSPKLMKEYHTYVQSLSNVSFDAQLLKEDWSAISDEETFKRLVVMTSLQSSVEAYRFLEKLEKEMDPSSQKDWVRMGLIHAQMILEQSLMDNTIGFIVSGLGGMGSRLRYNVVIRSHQPITEHLAQSILAECQSMDSRFDMVCEKIINFQSNFIQIQLLVPFQKTPELLIRSLLDRYDFLDDQFMESNMRLFEKDEIDNWLKST